VCVCVFKYKVAGSCVCVVGSVETYPISRSAAHPSSHLRSRLHFATERTMNVSTHGGASQAVPPRRTRRTFMGMKITRTREKAVAATLLSVLIIGCLFIVMSLLLVQRSNNRKRERINSDQVGAINQVVLECQDAVAAASHATSFLEGFVMGSMKSLPPLNGSISARQADQSFSRFMDVSTLEMSNVPTVIFVISAPGGAFLQSTLIQVMNKKSLGGAATCAQERQPFHQLG